jgi:hypothetical protein
MSINANALKIVILLFLLFAVFLRLYKFDSPVADWHSWRQADTSSVSRTFVDEGFNLLIPKYHDLSNVPSGRYDNPEGYRFVEFPIYNLFQGGLYQLFGILSLEQWGRLVSIFSSFTAALFLYLIFVERKQRVLGIAASFFFLFIPFNIYYSRTILPDMMMVAMLLGATYFFQKWLNKKQFSVFNLQFITSLLFMILALLLKPYALFFTLPFFYLAYEKFGKEFYKNKILILFTILSLTPFILWRIWMLNFPAGIPQSAWLLNGNGIRFRPSFFRWIFFERLTKLIAGYWGMIIFAAGVFSLFKHKDKWFIASFVASSLLYVTVFATGNVQHDYYQILVMPTVSILFAIGALFLYRLRYKNLDLGKLLVVIGLFGLFYLGWGQIKDYYNIDHPEIISAGSAVERLTPKDAKVIALYNGDTTFLYHTKRKGWASWQNSLPVMIKKGAEYLAIVNPNEAELEFADTYEVLERTQEYVIYKLK